MEDISQQIEELKLEIEMLRNDMKKTQPHRHCLNCGISVPPDKNFCSQKCEDEWNRMVKRKKQSTYIWLIFFVILMLILLLTSWGA